MDWLKMELFKEIFAHTLIQGKVAVSFSGIDGQTVAEIIEGECYQALQKIKAVLDDDALNDPECFKRIEEIVCALEKIGSNGGTRYDFG